MFPKFPKIDVELIKRRTTSLKAWELERPPQSSWAPEGIWINHDTEPVPEEQRTWTTTTFIGYWASDIVSTTSWSAISSFVSLGLTWWESVIAYFIGCVLLAAIVTVNGVVGTRLHTNFAITARTSFGYWFALFPVLSRIIIGGFWLSINTFSGGQGVTQIITAIWPQYSKMPNHLSTSSGLTSSTFLSFVIFWIFQFPFVLIHPTKLRPIFVIKAIAMPLVGFGTLIWAGVQAGDKATAVLTAASTLDSQARALAWLQGITMGMASWATMACNISDYSRYCKDQKSITSTMWLFPFMSSFVTMMASIAVNCVYATTGEVLYTPFSLIATWQGSHGGRAAAFFASLAWCLGNMCTNITGNSIAVSNDLSAIFPKYLDIRRASIVAIIVGVFGFAPWKVLASATNFMSFVASYSIIMLPMAGVLGVDYFLVKKGKVDVRELYDPHGIYRYWHGINWRALVAVLIGIGPNLPGMANAINSNISIGNWSWLYALSDLYGLIAGGLVYYVANRMFPHRTSLLLDGEDKSGEMFTGATMEYDSSAQDQLDDKYDEKAQVVVATL